MATKDSDKSTPPPGNDKEDITLPPGLHMTPGTGNNIVEKPVEISSRTGKPKRRKAARACTNCQRTHLTCDDDRPCERCVKRGCASTCVDGERKKSKRARGSSSGSSATEKPDFSQVVPEILGQHISSMDLSQQQKPSSHIRLLHTPPSQHAHYHSHPQPVLAAPHTTNNFTAKPHVSNHMTANVDLGLSHGLRDIEDERPGQHLHSSSDRRTQSAALDAFELLPDYFEPLDSYPLPVHPVIGGFSRELGSTGGKDGSVITSMLHGHLANSGNMGKSGVGSNISQFPGYFSSYAGVRSTASHDVGEPHGEETLPWLELPMNPLVNAHDETSRRFSYHYEHPDPSEIYRKVTEPHPHRKSFNKMVEYLKESLSPSEFNQITEILTKLKTLFYNSTKSLSPDDNLFVEQSFQRSLLEEEKQFALTPVPCLVWRRSGLIAAVSPRFAKLVQWDQEQLKSGYIMDVMSNESILRYFQKLQLALIPGNSLDFRFECVLQTPSGDEIPTEAEITIRMDIFNVPLMIIGRFWVQ